MFWFPRIYCLDIVGENGVALRPMFALGPEPSANEEDTVYVESEKVAVEPAGDSHRVCTRCGGKQRSEIGKWSCREHKHYRRQPESKSKSQSELERNLHRGRCE